ncbi:hypothetical protein IMY05_C4889000200 [Salix suchowensis]|nr:hypothetical protein IMY05_C4889000200 [Salix suchowensis]
MFTSTTLWDFASRGSFHIRGFFCLLPCPARSFSSLVHLAIAPQSTNGVSSPMVADPRLMDDFNLDHLHRSKDCFPARALVSLRKSRTSWHNRRVHGRIFQRLLEHFKEMEYLTAGSDVQVFIKRRMLKSGVYAKGPQRHDPTGPHCNVVFFLGLVVAKDECTFGCRCCGATAKGCSKTHIVDDSHSPQTQRIAHDQRLGSEDEPPLSCHTIHAFPNFPSTSFDRLNTTNTMGKEKKKRRLYVLEPEVRTCGDQQDSYMVDATTPDAPTDGSGLVIRTRAKRYLNSVCGLSDVELS